MKSILAILAIFVFIGLRALPGVALVTPSVEDFMTNDAVPFIKERTLIDLGDQRPTILFLNDVELQARFQASVIEENTPVLNKTPEMKKAMRVEAFYDPETRTIALKDTWDVTNVMDQVKLVHELTHFAQQVSGQDKLYTMCVAAHAEEQAWAVTLRWLRKAGYDKTNPEEFAKLQFTGLQQGTCMDPEAHP